MASEIGQKITPSSFSFSLKVDFIFISVIIPNIQIILDNLYQSINDMKLFIIDLLK